MALLVEDEVLRAETVNNQGRSNGRGTDQGQEPSPQNNRNGNGCGRGLLAVGFPPFDRNTQASEQNTSHCRGRESNHGNPLSLREIQC